MADPDELLAGFAAELEAGADPDPREWIARAEGGGRQELADLIDRYLMTAPRRAWDPVAYESSLAKLAVDRVHDSLEGVSGSWPELLPRLRNRARIRRGELVERLAGALGVGRGEAQLEKVGGYYHRMERGLLPAAGVSGRVIDALAEIVGASPETIRSAGLAGPRADAGVAGGAGRAFARLGSPEPHRDADEPEPVAMADESEPVAPRLDAIDELFTRG